MTDEVYLDKPEQWVELAAVLRGAGEFGLDTEFSGVDLGVKSPVGRARIHVWSVAVRTPEMDPRGFHRCRGWVLPAAALECPELVAVLERLVTRKVVHNQSVDAHALATHGITLRGGINSLGYIRWKRPGLINNPGRFALKPLMLSLLGREPVCTFKQLCSWERVVLVSTWKTKVAKHCECGAPQCRKRAGDHRKIETPEEHETVKEVTQRGTYELAEIVPGHERWDLLVRYALDDAVAALQVKELADETADPAPFPYAPGGRPRFSQEVEEAVIEMEAVGFRVDVEWCRETAERAMGDEEAELNWLYRWYVLNSHRHGPHRREDVDPIWSSPKQKLELFDELGFPRSPIWSKGKVKRGDVKLDWAAVGWIAAAHPASAQLIGHLLQLGRIRSGKKYLVKLRDSGGWVNPMCGPAGDDDDRAGAVTGRLGIKGELEAQQLPQREDKDLYHVRRAIVA